MPRCSTTALAFDFTISNHFFQEFRIDDYIKAYSTTGRPPAPCPPLPSGERERIAVGLPPLFRPTPVKATDEDSNTAANGPADGSSLPATQLYHTLASNPGGDVWHTITVQSEYSNYSHEVRFRVLFHAAVVFMSLARNYVTMRTRTVTSSRQHLSLLI